MPIAKSVSSNWTSYVMVAVNLRPQKPKTRRRRTYRMIRRRRQVIRPHVGRRLNASFVVNSPDSRVKLNPAKKNSRPDAFRRHARSPQGAPVTRRRRPFLPGSSFWRAAPRPPCTDCQPLTIARHTFLSNIRATPRSFTTSSACPRTRMPARSRRRTARRPSRTTPTREATRRR